MNCVDDQGCSLPSSFLPFSTISFPSSFNTNQHSVITTEQSQTFPSDAFQSAVPHGSVAPSQSYIPPASLQMPVNVLTAPISASDPAGLTGAVVPLVQPSQPPATPIQLADIIPHAAPLQTQPVIIPQHAIVPQQQIGMDPQTSTIQQQPQQQMEAQVALLDQRLAATQPPMEKQAQGLSATAVLTEPQQQQQQQMFAQQPLPAVHSLPEQKLFPAATGMEQPPMSLPLEQHQAYRSQQTAENYEQMAIMQPQKLHHTPQQQQALLQQHQASLYVKQQLDQQQQQQAFLQAQLTQQQQQLDQQQALIQNKLLDQQQQILIQQQEQKQQQQAFLQPKLEQQQELPRQQQQQPQSQLYQQCGQNLVGLQTDSEKPQQQQQPGSQEQTHQTQQQQVLMQQLQQHQLQQLQQQEQQQAQLKQQMEQQQQALLQQQLDHQKQLMFQQQQAERLQQQALLQQQIQEQQQATVIHPQQSETGDTAAFPQSKSEQQMQQQFTEMQHPYIPQANSSQYPIRAGVGQQHAAFIQKQQGFVGQPQLHPSSAETHVPVGAPPNTEVAQQKQIVPQAHVAMAIQPPQIPAQTPAVGPAQVLTQQVQNVAFPQGQMAAQFITQPAASAMSDSQVILQGSVQGQVPTFQTQQIPLQTAYPGTVPPTQNQVTAQELIQSQPLQLTHGQSLSQTGVQPPTAMSSTHPQIQHETCAQPNLQPSGLIQAHLHHQAFEPSVLQLQSAAAHFTPQYAPQPTHPATPSLTDKSYIPQPQQESVQQYQQMPPASAGIIAPTTEMSPPLTDPNIAATLQQARQTSTPGQAPVCPVTQVEQKSTGSAADPSVVEAAPQSAGQYQELQQLAQGQQPLAPSCPQPQLLSRFISTPAQQPHPPPNPAAAAAAPHQATYPAVQAVSTSAAGAQSQDRSLPFYSDSAAGVPSSPQHQTKPMLPAHTHTQTSIQSQTHSQTQTHAHAQAHSHTQTHTETPAPEQPTVPLAVFPAPQMPLSPTHTSCPPTSLPLLLPSLPPYPPAAEPLTELPTSPPPAAQVASPERADFIPTSPPPVTAPHSLESNAPKLPQASLQDCDPPLLGTAQVQEAGQFFLICFVNYNHNFVNY